MMMMMMLMLLMMMMMMMMMMRKQTADSTLWTAKAAHISSDVSLAPFMQHRLLNVPATLHQHINDPM
jgi:hypothetical protein